MAHAEQRRFIELVSQHLFKRARPMRILEVGSCDVNGTIRHIFRDSTSYIGADLVEGPGVDIVKAGQDIDLASDSVDLALSCECFEHNPYWLKTFQNMTRMTRPGGLIVFTCASRGRVEHGTDRSEPGHSPGTTSLGWNYYRNLRQADFESGLNLAGYFTVFRFYYVPSTSDLYFFGVKKGGEQPDFDLAAFEAEVDQIRLMEKERFKDLGVFKRALWKVYKMPLVVASHLLNEKGFQSFATRYVKVGDMAKPWVGWHV
ncbi:MAG: methyltransferase domain-containing protein [Terriglobia bacterium]